MVKYTPFLISSLILSIAQVHADDNKLFLFRDLSSYQSHDTIDIKDSHIIELPDTTVLDSFKYQLFLDNERLSVDRVKIIEKNEENIYVVNEGHPVIINDRSPEILITHGADFIKTKSDNDFVRYTPKSKIDSLQFQRNIDAQSHIAQIIPFAPVDNVTLNTSYTLGDLSWKPTYSLHLLDDNTAIFDYFIEVENDTNMDFKNVELAVSTDSMQRVLREFDRGVSGYIFSVFQQNNQPQPIYQNFEYDMRSNMDVMELADGASFSKTSHATSIQTVMGKESIVFSEPMNIDAQSKSSLDYDINNSFDYIKKNKAQIQFAVGERPFISQPTTEIEILRKDDKDSMKLMNGVLSVYNGDDLYNGQLFAETQISQKDEKDNLYINIGVNNNIDITTNVLDKKPESFYIEQVEKIQNGNINININTNGNSQVNDDTKSQHYIQPIDIDLYKVQFTVEAESVLPGDNLTINSNRMLIAPGNIDRLRSLLKRNPTMTRSELERFHHDLQNNYQIREFVYNENDLKSTITEDYYMLIINYKNRYKELR